jgi:hypothetical protein
VSSLGFSCRASSGVVVDVVVVGVDVDVVVNDVDDESLLDPSFLLRLRRFLVEDSSSLSSRSNAARRKCVGDECDLPSQIGALNKEVFLVLLTDSEGRNA